MNKPKLKKLLTLFVCLMLITSMVVLTACNKDDTPATDKTTSTAEPSFTNGNFTAFSTSDSYPKTPTSWTAMTTIGDDLPKITDNTVAGIISLNSEIYDNYKSKWGDLEYFAKYSENLSKDYTADDDVLMIYNKKPSYFTYTSTSFTASANTYYKLSVDIKTTGLDGGANKGATLTLTDGNGYYLSEFKTINTDSAWTRYTFYIKGKLSGTNTLKIQLTLGAATTDAESAYLTSGYAFFDNVQFDTVTADEENDKTASEVFADYVKTVTNAGNQQYVDLSVPNPNFDFVQTAANAASYPALYTRRSSSDSNALYGRVSLDNDFAASMISIFGDGVVSADAQTPGYAGGTATRYANAYALYAKSETVVGFSTTSKMYFKRGNAYAITVWVNAEAVTSGKVHIALASASDEITSDDTLVYDIDAGTEGWKPYTFVLVADQNTATELFFHIWLGNSTEKATGYALFDNLSVANPSLADYANVDEIVAEYQAKQTATVVSLDKTINEDKSKLLNGYFSSGNSNGWEVMSDDGKTNMLNGVDNTNVETSVITINDENSDEYQSAYYQVSRNILKIDSKSTPTVYGLAYNTYRSATSGLKEKLQPYTSYRFSVWVKTVDVQSTAGVILTVYNGVDKANRTAVATYSFVNTKDISEADGLNGYRELSCYFYTGATEEEISFELTFGTGTQWTATTLFDGVAYVSNASLTVVDYSDFNSASSTGTYQKKYNYNTYSNPEFTNGQFDTYKLPTSSTTTGVTKGFTGDANDGKVDGVFQNTLFGVPDGWTLGKDSSIKSDMTAYFEGLVDLDRQYLLTNLKTAAGADTTYGGVKLSDYNFNDNLFFNYSGTDKKLYTYVGGNKALMLAAADNLALTGVNFASLYATSSSISLSANSYYEISVLVKTLGTTRASVYLTSDNSYEANATTLFNNISTTSATATNGWQKYTFRIKIGLAAVTAQLKVCLGQSDKPTDTLSGSMGGAAFFDYITLDTITEKVFEEDITGRNDIVTVALDTDSFGDVASTADTTAYCSPTSSTWTGIADVTAGDNNKSGIVKKDSFDFEANGKGLENVLAGYNGSNSCLAINNVDEGAYHYINKTGVTFAKNSYYKISVYVKTYNLSENGKAYVKLTVNGYDKADDGENIIYVCSDEYQVVEFYVKAPATNTLTTSVFLTLGLGEEGSLVSGIAVFDNVKYEQITVTEAEGDKNNTNFKALAVGDYATAVVYNDIEETEVDPEKSSDDDNTDTKNNYRWVIFTSVAFGAVIVIIVVIYFIKKYLPKKKEKTDFSKKPKKADKLDNKDDYKDLQD